MSTNTNMQRRYTWLLSALLMAVGSMTGYAQSDCFTYEDPYDKTVINGIEEIGLSKTSLTIPKEVTTVRSGAFNYTFGEDRVTELKIEAGGNPVFEANLFGTTDNTPNPNRLTNIEILGTSMTVANIKNLFASLVAQGDLSTVYVEGYSGAWSDITETAVLTSDVSVSMPAALVTTQQFGDAKVYGRFTIDTAGGSVTFCGNATFQDADEGSNMLFYVADEYKTDGGNVHVQRVLFIKQGEGVLIHNATNTSTSADLLRVSDGDITEKYTTLYGKNMFKGVTTATEIGATDGDKTNFVLYQGEFHPTSGGPLRANRAYLQVPTAAFNAATTKERLSIDFEGGETGITLTPASIQQEGKWYDLQGRQLSGNPTVKGIYLINGRKVAIQ